MKLFLSSYRIPVAEPLYDLLDDAPERAKVAIIYNAKDYYAERARSYKLREIQTFLSSVGFSSTEEVDLRNLSTPDQTYNVLSKFNMLWVAGGNTFCLREQMQRSGFDEIVNKLLDDGIIYCGESAGAVAAGTSLRGIESADIPEFAGKAIHTGLGLLNAVLLPHADNEMFADSTKATREAHPGQMLIELRDDEALVVNGNTSKIHRAPSENQA